MYYLFDHVYSLVRTLPKFGLGNKVKEEQGKSAPFSISVPKKSWNQVPFSPLCLSITCISAHTMGEIRREVGRGGRVQSNKVSPFLNSPCQS